MPFRPRFTVRPLHPQLFPSLLPWSRLYTKIKTKTKNGNPSCTVQLKPTNPEGTDLWKTSLVNTNRQIETHTIATLPLAVSPLIPNRGTHGLQSHTTSHPLLATPTMIVPPQSRRAPALTPPRLVQPTLLAPRYNRLPAPAMKSSLTKLMSFIITKSQHIPAPYR